MAKEVASLFAFCQGEVSRLALGRVDVARLRLAAECQVNWMPWVIGPMMLRPGLQFVGEVLADQPAKLVRFIFSKLDTALLEFTPLILRVWVNEALVTRAAVATTISDSGFATGVGWVTTNTTSGASVVIGSGVCTLQCKPVGGLAQVQQTVTVAAPDQATEHGLRLVITNGPVTFRCGTAAGLSDLVAQTVLDTGTHSLAFTPNGATFVLQIESTDAWNKTLTSVTIDSAGALQLPTPWAAGNLPDIRYDESGDVIFFAGRGLQQYKIERRSTTSWSVVKYRSGNGPFQSAPGILANFTSDSYFGNGNLTSDRPFFQSGHVGALFRLFNNGQVFLTTLGNNNAFSPPVRVSGVGSSRNYTWTGLGTYVGVLTWQRSFDAPDSGFVDVGSAANGATGTIFTSSTGGSGGSPDLDNIIAWERVGFKGGNYTSGNVQVSTNYGGDGAFAIVRVTGFVSATQVTIEILQPFGSILPTTDWLESDWSGVQGWPSAVAFFDGRLFWLGRDKFWGSEANNFVGFATADATGTTLGDAGAINEQFGAGPVDTINWGLGLTRLLAGREGVISSIRASYLDDVLTPANVSSKDCSTQGAARLPAIKLDTRGIFVQQSGRRIYELVFSPQAMDYQARDLTAINLDIGKPGFVDLDIARQPDTTIYMARGDGHVACLLHDIEDEVECWWRLQTAGVVENVAVLPNPNGIEDLVYFVVRRTVNGVTRRFIERLALRDNCAGGLINQQADAHFAYTGAAVSTVRLSWLPNTQVVVWADGVSIGTATTDGSGNCAMPDGHAHSNIVVGLGGQVVIGSTTNPLVSGSPPDQIFSGVSNTLTVPTRWNGCPAVVFADIGGTGKLVHVGTLTVSSGTITLNNARTASTIVACIGYVAPFMSAKLAYAARMGSALTQKKKLDHVGIVAFDLHYQGVTYGQRMDALDPMPLMEGDQVTAANTVWPEYDEPMIELPGEWNTDTRLCLLAQAPNPATIGGLVLPVQTNEKG